MPRSLMFLAMLTVLALPHPRDAAADEIRKPRLDLFGDPLPDEVIARMGSSRMRHTGLNRPPVAFTPDGKSIVTGGRGELRIWDPATGKRRRRIPIAAADDWCYGLAFYPDGIVVASASEKSRIVTVQVLDPTAGKVRKKREMPDCVFTAPPVFSREGKLLAYGRGSNSMCIYESESGREMQRIAVPGLWPRNLVFAPDGKTIAFTDQKWNILIHDTATGKSVREFKAGENFIPHLAISPNGRFLACVSNSWNNEVLSGQVSVFDLATGEERHRLKTPSKGVYCAAFSPDSKYLATGGVEVLLWDVASGKEVRRYPGYPTLLGDSAVVFSPDGKTLARRSGFGAIRLYDVATARVLPSSADPYLGGVQDLRFSSDGRRLLGRTAMYLSWDPRTGREIRRMKEIPGPPTILTLSPDESLLAGGDAKGSIHLWDAKTLQLVRTLKGHEKRVYQTWFVPDGQRLVSLSADNTIRVWDLTRGSELYRFANDRMRSPALSPDSHWIATASHRNPRRPEIVLWDLSTGREKWRGNPIRSLLVEGMAFSPDSRFLVSIGRGLRNDPGEVVVWHVADGKLKHSLDGPKSDALSVAYSPDGRTLAAGYSDGTLILWETATGRKRHQFVTHEPRFHSLAFSPDSRLLASSSDGAPVYLWDVAGSLEFGSRRLSKDELQRCWTKLAGDDAVVAFEAVRRLAAAPEQTLPFLRQHLKPVPASDAKHIRQLVDMLDSEDFQKRQNAAEELERQADSAAGLLRQIIAKEKPSLEVRRRLQPIVEGIESKPETLRAVRAVEVLEWIATPEAVRLLDELGKGAADARLTREAAAAKRRQFPK